MNIVAPITQGYLFSEIYNSVGGNSMVAGLPISEWETAGQTGGAKLHEDQANLAVPAGLVVIEDAPQHKIKYRTRGETKCEVIPDDLFDKLVDMVKVGKVGKPTVSPTTPSLSGTRRKGRKSTKGRKSKKNNKAKQ
jgi:hypothetical protein